LLYGTALLAEGGVPEDPGKFAGLLADRLGSHRVEHAAAACLAAA
jgi:hypothetical protein